MTDLILEEKREGDIKTYYVNGNKVKWLVKTTLELENGGSGVVTIKYKIEKLAGMYERQFSTIVVKKEVENSTTWELVDELQTADWVWDKQIARGVLI
jgi:hypothetical protein